MNFGETLYVMVFLIVFAAIGVSLYYDHKLKIPPAPTLPWVRRKILHALKTHLAPDTEDLSIVELGSGWGDLGRSIARTFPKARVQGFELSPFPYWFSKLRQRRNLTFTRGDIFTQDLSGYDAVVYYLSPVVAERLSAKFKAELKPGTLIISNAFQLPGFDPVEVLETKVGVNIRIYIYRKEQ